MIPKTSAISGLMLMFLFAMPLIAIADFADQDNPQIRVSFDACVSFIGESSTDYSEFTGEETNYPDCSTLSLAFPGNVYRTNDQAHSCTPGLEDTNAMCVDGHNGCNYDPGNIKSLRFNVRVIPSSLGFGSIDKISFYEQAPEEYMFTFGETGPNDYPTMLALRILRNGQEIYRQTDIPTSRTWTLREFDLRTIMEMTVTEESVFSFEILGYCPVGNGAEKRIWDIEELVIEGDCNNTFGGFISTDDPTTICQKDNVSTSVSFSVTGEMGNTSRWILMDDVGGILSISNMGSYDFATFPNGMYTVYHLVHDATLSGLELGNNLSDLTGCFDLSNGVVITNSILQVEEFRTEDNFTDAYICSNEADVNLVSTSLTGVVGMVTEYLITGDNNIIIETVTNSVLDFGSFPEGSYNVYAVVHNGGLFNAAPGFSITELMGCFLLSEPIFVRKEFLEIGSISINGETEIDLCGSESMMVSPDVMGPAGLNPIGLVTDAQGVILDMVTTAPFDITQYDELEIRIYLISSLGRLDNFEIGNNVSEIEGCFLLSNFITINNDPINGGTIDVSGEQEVFICQNDTVIDSVRVNLEGNEGTNSDWLVTTEDGDILLISDSNAFDFSSVPPGICLIWHLSSLDDLQGLFVGNNVSGLEGCFSLSNTITVTRDLVEAGTIMTSDNLTEVTICSGDGNADIITVVNNNVSAPFSSLVVTDTLGNILEIPSGTEIDFEGVEDGVCRIYLVASESDQVLEGNNLNVNQLADCTEISNAITVIRHEVSAGVIETENSEECVTFLTMDSTPDSLEVTVSGNIGDNAAWLVTDTLRNILDIPASSPFGFENVQADTFLLWYISYSDGTTGIEVGTNLDGIVGCFAISSSIKVIRENINGGILATVNMLEEASICLGDNEADTLRLVLSNDEGPNVNYVVTNDQDTIVELSDDPLFTFENAPPGVCYIYHIAYLNGLQGLDLGNALGDLTGTFDLSNRVTVTRSTVVAGSISGSNSQTEYSICSGDGIPDSLMLSVSGNMGTNAQWIVTDTARIILELLDEAPADFEGVAEGRCFIYHISYLPGIVGLSVGSDLDNVQGCFGLSNRVIIDRSFVDGGILLLEDGTTLDTIIVGDQLPDSLDFDLSDTAGDTMLWVITDTMGVILQLPMTMPPFDFNDFDAGVCRVWYLSANGTLGNVAAGNNVSQLTGCFDLSNPVTLVKETIDGGVISSMMSLDICLSDLQADTIDFDLDSAFGSNSAWIITDADSLILELPVAPPFDFGGAGPGICLVWHLSYEDNLMGLATGNSISDFTGSFDLSNTLTVTRESVTGGTITLDSGSQDTMIMVGIGLNDTLDVIVSGVNGADTASYIITDTLGLILGVQDSSRFVFESAGGGVCQIWFLPYLNGLTGLEVGNNVADLNGCYALSAQPLTVIREGLMGGNLLTSDGLDQVAFCVGDGEDDLVNVMLSDTMGPMHSWIITDTLGEILELPMAPPFNFESTPVGVCEIWNIAHTSSLMGLMVGENLSGLMGNFDLSNPIRVIRSAAEGGTIETNAGEIEVTITIGDNIPELVSLRLMGALGDNSIYLVTDTLGNIQALEGSATFNFESGNPGACDIYHLSFGNGLQGLQVGNNLSQMDGCFDLSNSVRVFKEELILNGGIISTMDDTIRCAGDGIPDSINITLMNESGTVFNYFLTDTNDVIIALLPNTPVINLEQANDGVFRLRHISYVNNGVMGLQVGNMVSDITGIFAISNFITIVNNGVDGGELRLLSGAQDTAIMVGDGIDDFFDVTLTGEIGDGTTWVITDITGEIVALPSAPPFNLEGAIAGTCRVWNLSTNGGVTGLTIGNNVSQLSGCFDFSNPITVARIGLNGGTLATPEGSDTTNVCFAEMMIPDSVQITLTGEVGPNQDWIITTNEDTILLIPNAGPPFDFSTAGIGTCYVYHIAYENGLMGLQGGQSINDLSGMFNLSNRFVVLRNEADGGMIMTDNNTVLDTIEVNDGMPDTINIVQNGTVVGDQNMYVLTGNNDEILAIQDSTTFIFETQPGGTCRIWSISYNNELTGLSVGNNISDLNGCFDLSNEVTVVRLGLNGGNLTTTDGLTEVYVCSNDGISDQFDVMLTDTSGTNHNFILTSADGIILSTMLFQPFDFESLQGGATELRVYNIAYGDDIMGFEVFENLSGLSGSFDLSNPINITRDFNSGGTIVSNNSFQIVDIIVGEGIIDTVEANFTSNMTPVGDTSAWVIQNVAGEFIDLPEGPPFFFEDSTLDTCFISHIAFSFGLNGLEVGNTIDSLDGCFNFSNQITVAKKRIDGGVLALTNGMDSTSVCVGDGVDDILGITLMGHEGVNQDYFIVDSSGLILDIMDTANFNFEGLGGGECRLYSISYTGTLNGLIVGQNVSNIDGCFALSNPIIVTRIAVFGGAVSLDGGATEITICLNDTIPDVLSFTTNSNSLQYTYVITDTDNIIDTVLTTTSFDFFNSTLDSCLVYGVSYTGDFIATSGQNITLVDLSTECADLSGNSILIYKEQCPGMPVVNEISSGGLLEIKNVGFDTIDVSDYIVCMLSVYDALGNMNVNCGGSFLLEPDSLITVELSASLANVFDAADGEAALYVPNGAFGNPDDIVDYVEWGSSGHTRSDVAAAAGIWMAGDFASAFAQPNSLHYDGDGNSSLDWSVGPSNLCATNFDEPEEDDDALSYKMYPNPVSENLIIDFERVQKDVVNFYLYDSNGRLIIRRTVLDESILNIDMIDLKPGMYYSRLTKGFKSKTDKIIIVE